MSLLFNVPDGTSFRAKMYDITQHKKFKAGTVLLILVNCALLGQPVSTLQDKQLQSKQPVRYGADSLVFVFLVLIVYVGFPFSGSHLTLGRPLSWALCQLSVPSSFSVR